MQVYIYIYSLHLALIAEELAGKAAVFKCTIHKIEAKELPALDDDFAKDVSEFDTLDEYKKEIKDNLTKKKEEQAKTEKEIGRAHV